MALTKQTITDRIESLRIEDHYVLQVRERNQILEDGKEISASFNRYVLEPDADTSTITDGTVLSQFNVVMTDQVKANYTAFLEAQKAELNSENA